jgi:deoxyribodipyrimidine photo-lyase
LKKTLFWFRNDLRTQDNAALACAMESASEIGFVYVHDPRLWQLSSAGLPRLGWHRRRFLKESLCALSSQLATSGFCLTELWGFPETILPEIIELEGFDSLVFSKDPAPFEKSIEQELIYCSKVKSFSIHSEWTHFLLNPEMLTKTFTHLPQTFTDFRNRIEKHSYESIVPQLQPPCVSSQPKSKPVFKDLSSASHQFLNNSENTSFIGLEQWWLPNTPEKDLLEKIQKPNAPTEKMDLLRGGAPAGLKRVQDYFVGTHSVLKYFETRNGLLDVNDSTLFSAWLANGSISARQIFWQLKEFENQHGNNKSTYWVVFELLWREFFKIHLKTHGERFFHPEGLYRGAPEGSDTPTPWEHSMEQVLECKTGQPFVDANLRELIQTGFMSNRGRQNVASYLIYQMKIPWTHVASFFETFLIDYDPASNWGNCAYIAGVSFDPRGGRPFNVEKQQKDYDPDGNYLQAWL